MATSLTNNSGKHTVEELTTLTAVTTSFKHLGLLNNAATQARIEMQRGLTSRRTGTAYARTEIWKNVSARTSKQRRRRSLWVAAGSHSSDRGREISTASRGKERMA